MPNEMTVEYNIANWREATKNFKFSNLYTGVHQSDTIYFYNTSFNSESWIFDNPEILETVRRGLKDAAQGRVSKVNLNEL
jgi:hypothetical protein